MNAQAFYTRLADSYDVTLTLAGYRMAVDYFIRHIPIERTLPLRILDAGCGTGFYSLSLLRRFRNSKIIAFDLNHNMIQKLKLKIEKKQLNRRISVLCAEMMRPLPLERENFDLVVTAGVLEYVRIGEAVENLGVLLSPN